MGTVVLLFFGALLIISSVTAQPTAPTTSPENYNFIFSSSSGCAPSACTYFIGVNLNQGDSNYVDIYIEGQAGGYVAAGFTPTQSMFNADVVACTRDSSNNMIQALDTWNLDSMRNNRVDPINDVMLFSGEYVNGRIRCSVTKPIIGSDTPEDINLNTDLFLLFASRDSLSPPTALQYHNIIIGRSQSTFSFPPMAATNPPPTTPITEGTMATEPTAQASPVAPVIQPADSRLTFRQPADCAPSECDIFVGINTNTANNGYLDIFLEGEAAGWVAVGFSEDGMMFSADVVACNRNPNTEEVEVLDARNLPSNQRGSPMDAIQNVVLFSGEVVDGRIRCSVAKEINSGDTVGDLNLNNDYFVIYARRQANSISGALTFHMANERFIAENATNPVTDGGAGAGTGISSLRQGLTRAHGILMMIAWMLLFLNGTYFATWMRPALPNGEWFQVHRAMMIASLFIALLAFMLIFIANKDNSTPGLIDLSSGTARVHFAFGIMITTFQIANPIISLFRCKPDHKYRWIFNTIHGYMIGRWAEGFSFSTIALGLTLFSTNFAGYSNHAALWLYIAFVCAYLILVIINIVFYIISWKKGTVKSCGKCKPEKSEAAEMSPMGGNSEKPDPTQDQPKERKEPSKDAPIRWVLYGVFLTLLVPVLIALIVLVALPQ